MTSSPETMGARHGRILTPFCCRSRSKQERLQLHQKPKLRRSLDPRHLDRVRLNWRVMVKYPRGIPTAVGLGMKLRRLHHPTCRKISATLPWSLSAQTASVTGADECQKANGAA